MYKLIYGVALKAYAVLVDGKIIGIVNNDDEAKQLYMRYALERLL